MSIFNVEQTVVVEAADAVSRSDASLKQAIATLIGEKLVKGQLKTIPNDEQNKLVSELLTLVRTASDGETVWAVKDCREAKPGTAMHKAGQRYGAIHQAYSRMKPKAEKAKGSKKAEADPKKPSNVVVLPIKSVDIVGFCDSMVTMLQNVGEAEYDIARVKAALVALKEAAKPNKKK